MTKSPDEWREELREIDAELLSLLQRRVELAIEFLQILSSADLSLGDLDQDALRLGILLLPEFEGNFSPLDEGASKKIFRRIAVESRRLAYASLASEPGDERKLTPREREILILIAEDLSLKKIALELNISVKTVESH